MAAITGSDAHWTSMFTFALKIFAPCTYSWKHFNSIQWDKYILFHLNVGVRAYEGASIISGTGAGICTEAVVVRCNGRW
jgi:hypothetical protein